LVPALRIYRDQFQPSNQLDGPFVMPCVNIILADTDDQAEYLSTSMKQMMMGVVTGERKPMPPPVDNMNTVWNIHHKMAVERMLRYSFVGSPSTVENQVDDFIEMTGADELMIASYIYDKKERFKSYKLFAGLIKEDERTAEIR
jgi:alkanesulfonate monooxygenase SsuD/methylene tetrahydromethanopterin reductase-like flavin-dependent oxidoreductase (luciferase family)